MGSAVTLALSWFYFKYRIFKPYEKAVTQAIDQSQKNLKEQGKLIKKQDAIIGKLQQRLDEREDFKNSLGMN